MLKTKIENKKVKYVNESKADVHGIRPGQEIEIEVDKEGTPLDFHIRRRVRDGDCLKEKKAKSGGKK